ncbi:hemocyte protein-glutamine gamma-glutamyltransferase-like [Chrysoperla carnea]|uniref:hemocyte protein-glutamine gamma-glutamyltransferase-like n=1 Tax=Chrysoperla carnea TaxID=189513 RepID=UPI001D05F7C1|nr:hemocyte protein-glutamine gamma-glutamyltransferase-like [Chrysoperla carnea]XP_044729883.1 hemocyte protein-glutamine gamma-glutamyltransferase-like [Chrysoperla carnea]
MSEILEVELIYLYPQENAKLHHTENYELLYDEPACPVLRRGNPFTAVIRFANRPFNEDTDVIKLVFTYGPNAHVTKGTKNILRLTKKTIKTHKNLWSAKIIHQQDTTLTLQITTSVNCPVGNWNLYVESGLVNSTIQSQNFEFDADIYILFNPWNKDDVVYMPDERLLDEYILTDVGKIWVGPMGSSRGREWVFGQFDKNLLLGTMLMLERSNTTWSTRGDPVKLTRTISKMVNSNDDNGILVGRWDGDYEDGTAPAAWTGSIAIMEEFLENEEPVKYGQCWVFAGVVTSICRALGIPSRVVSNLVSAHDANSTLTIDRYYDKNNEALSSDPLNEEGKDSIWNYHVWNDVWMARCDLPIGYGGWQAIDATPQETSDGVFQCGPASLEAIKQGYLGYNYDVGFMLASVNADLINWKEDPKCEIGFTKIYCNKYHIGRMILTKQPWIFDPNGDKDREDITNQYKPKEGTEAERLSLMNAVRSSQLAKKFYDLPSTEMEDMEFDLVELDRINIGDSFQVTIKIKNKSNEQRTVQTSLSAASIFYTGAKANLVKKYSKEIVLKPHTTEKLSLNITADEYTDKLVEYCIMKLYAIATVKDTNQTWADEDDFQVLKPNIDIKILDEEITVGKKSEVELSFTNPLKKTLTNCKFHIAGSGLIKNQRIPFRNIRAKEHVKAKTFFIPKSSGDHKLIATFISKELVDMTGAAKIEVLDSEE